MNLAVEKLSGIVEEVLPLLLRHWEEIALDRDTVPLMPNWNLYKAAEDAGSFVAVVAREAGEIIGYSSYWLLRHPHYDSLFLAEADIYYLAPEYRRGMAGVKLMRFAENHVIGLGVNKIITRAKVNRSGMPSLGPLLERMGYKVTEHYYTKRV